VVRRGEDELRGAGAVGERRLEAGGDGEGSGNSGDDLEGDRVLAEEGDLLGGAAEDERVAGFEADDGAFVASVLEEQLVDPRLGDARLSAALGRG
jgi:hypothetical protein